MSNDFTDFNVNIPDDVTEAHLSQIIQVAFLAAAKLKAAGNGNMLNVQVGLKQSAAYFDQHLSQTLQGMLINSATTPAAGTGNRSFAWNGPLPNEKKKARLVKKAVPVAAPTTESPAANAAPVVTPDLSDDGLYAKIAAMTPSVLIKTYGDALRGIAAELGVEIAPNWNDMQIAAATKVAAKSKANA